MDEGSSRNLRPVTADIESVSRGRNIITVIGIDDYVNWPKLHNAVNDALDVQKLFVEKLGFISPINLLDIDATYENLTSLVQDQLYNELKPDDALVIFFAGHGDTRKNTIPGKTTETGYIIPVKAKTDHWADYIKIDSFLEDISRLPVRHILVILDSCFSGSALGNAMKISRSAVRYEMILQNNVSRKIITSARRDETALDGSSIERHSLFTGILLDGLNRGKADLDGNGLVTSSELGLFLQQQVGQASDSKQIPDFGSFHYDDRGEMLIFLRHDTNYAVKAQAFTASQPREIEGNAMVIKGCFVLKDYEPDGGSIRFIADDPDLYQNLHHSYKIKPSHKDGSVQLRLEAVAAPEIHYGTTAQRFGDEACDQLLTWMGFENIQYYPSNPNKVQSCEPETVRGAILSKAADTKGRPISYVILEDDAVHFGKGEWVKVDGALLKKTMNYYLLDQGMAYYMVCNSTPFIHCVILREVVLQARNANRGIWELDMTNQFILDDQKSVGPQGQLIFPKLFRRCTDYLKDVAKGYRGNLADWLISVSPGIRNQNDDLVIHNYLELRLSDLIKQHRNKIVFKADLLDIMFVEKC